MQETKFEGVCLARNENFLKRIVSHERDLNKYPSMESLREAISDFHEVKPSNVILGNGIIGVFRTVCMTLDNLGIREVQSNEKPYAGFKDILKSFGMNIVRDGANARLATNPSNPFGTYNYFPNDGSINIYDEAYIEYENVRSSIGEIGQGSTIVMRTFSKAYGMASIRVGYAIVSDNLSDLMRMCEGNYTLSEHSASLAEMAICSPGFLYKSIEANLISRLHLEKGLRDLGFTVTVSIANFVVANVPEVEGFSVRDLTPYGLAEKRITTSSIQVMDDYLTKLKESI